MNQGNPLLIIGGFQSGKTTFLAQLCIRLFENKGQVKRPEMAGNLSPIKRAITNLYNGINPAHTASNTNLELILPVRIDSKNFNLICPDYGGEQVNTVFQSSQSTKDLPDAVKETKDKWEKRVDESERWLLFIKIPRTKNSSTPGTKDGEEEKGNEFTDKISDQAFFIEFIQVLLKLKNIRSLAKITSPKLCIVLSFWDALKQEEQEKTPGELLGEKMPLFLDFIETAWDENALSIIGLSSLSKALDKVKSDSDFVEKGPQNFGYIILENGKRSDDLTLVIRHLFE